MSKSECACFERKLAYHTAPSLLGIKCASLVSLDSDSFDLIGQTERFNRLTEAKGLRIKLMCRCRRKTLLLLYNARLLEKSLSEPSRRKILEKYGYDKKCSVINDLERLSGRISSSEEFPHEIGIFLGYPTEDVVGFIRNKGENFKLCGCWKVYGDAENAKRIFVNYEKCRKFLCNKIDGGIDIYQALNIPKEEK